MRRRQLLSVLAVLAVPATALGAGAAPAGAAKAPLAGSKKCANGKYVLHVRVKGWSCGKGRKEAQYWETTGRGHCRKGYTFRQYSLPAGVSGPGGSYLSCGKGGVRVFWVEGGD
ncbi:hypothetical protein DSM112329_01208 [Paraconexibacter sp. AEG42_29]|uniref:Uncharacterized protein n=1 Tax=Paraconexibacter sp. AEG42_29 TaxID=2997339 RepID=A0AAU7AS02_9ACTN